MALSQFHYLAFISSYVVVAIATMCFSPAHGGGFSVDMFHRDSPGSPFYNPLQTRYERLSAAIRRSKNSAQRFNSSSSSVSLISAQATVTADFGEYLMNISLGSPPFPISAFVDTGSGLTWTQCKPCKDCYKQIDPIFNPKKSTTYREMSCKSAQCGQIFGTFCNGSSACTYSIRYGDQSYTEGVIAFETVTLGSTSSQPVALPKTIIGCGFNNRGTFQKEGSGIVGLSPGPESLISRLGSSIDGKFSYCLLPYSSYKTSKTSKLHFGDRAMVTGESAVSTPLFKTGHLVSFYSLDLEAISVGKKRLVYNEIKLGFTDSNIVVDSGSLLTHLPPKFYSKFESAVAEKIALKRAEDPNKELSLCYETRLDDLKLPKITVHFRGADLELTQQNIFIRFSKDVVCFAFASIENFASYGNLAQVNFLVGYDTLKQTMTFKPTDCSKTN